jgi:hypothetical protein
MISNQTLFSEEDIRRLEATMKVGLLGTVNGEGLPHLTLISSLKAAGPERMSFGQFLEGRSKQFLTQNPHAGWLIMTLDRSLWRGKALFTHTAKNGPDYDFYNQTPLFRYNAYLGIHTVYYLKLVEHTGRASLPTNDIVRAALKTRLIRPLKAKDDALQVLNPWTTRLFSQLNTVKFLAYIDKEGFPVIIPVIQAQPADTERIVFSASVYQDELKQIPEGVPVALFGLSLEMEDVLLRGIFEGLRRTAGVLCGSLRVNWVYNSLPPVPGQIYPPEPIKTVKNFE